MRKIVRLTESDLHRIIKESVNDIITECADIFDIKLPVGAVLQI